MNQEINIIATTLSGSIKDWAKINYIVPEFEKYFSKVKLIKVDSHSDAYRVAKKIVNDGGRIVIAAGGAGTLNSVIRGCYDAAVLPHELRIGVIRKGSADLIGKVLKISDNLSRAVKTLSEAIKFDNYIKVDLIKILHVVSKDIIKNDNYFIGFGGVGIFGDVPRYTENHFMKYYKGLLGYLFGDRGPFFVGATLAIISFYIKRLFNLNNQFKVIIDNEVLNIKRFNNILILNGDLGKDFPLAKGVPLGGQYYRVVVLEDLGFIRAIFQFVDCWTGKVVDNKNLGAQVFDVKSLKLLPVNNKEYAINVDGLLIKTKFPIEFKVVGQINLLSG